MARTERHGVDQEKLSCFLDACYPTMSIFCNASINGTDTTAHMTDKDKLTDTSASMTR